LSTSSPSTRRRSPTSTLFPYTTLFRSLVALRPHGKTTFAHLEDASGRIQLYFKGDELGTDLYGLIELLDLGDHIGVEGRLMKTRDRKSTRLNSSHVEISYAVFCLKKKN